MTAFTLLLALCCACAFFPCVSSAPPIVITVRPDGANAAVYKDVSSSPGGGGAITDLTASTFDDIVGDPTKHVLVKFYMPSCSHCMDMEQAFIDASARLADRDDVVIAQIDAEAFKDVALREKAMAFPAVRLFAKGSKRNGGIPFLAAERSAAAFENFVRKLAHY